MCVRSVSAAAPQPNAKLKSKMLEVWNSEFPTTLLFFIVFFYLATSSERYKLFCVAVPMLRWWKSTVEGRGLNLAIIDWNS